jgi:quercetin dioxygenase-like cupin family protein
LAHSPIKPDIDYKRRHLLLSRRGASIQKVVVGGLINILPGIKHWHSASPDAPMAHQVININTDKGIVNWLGHVGDEECNR